jgi:hypothetical protein
MNEYGLHAHRREHGFRKIGGKLAKFSTSATRISEEIYLKEAVYMYYPSEGSWSQPLRALGHNR